MTVGEALLTPHRSYLAEIQKLTSVGARGFAHITGGGFPENVARVLPLDLDGRDRHHQLGTPGHIPAHCSRGAPCPQARCTGYSTWGSVWSRSCRRSASRQAIGAVPEAVVIGEVVPRGDDAAVRLLGLEA